MLRQYFQDNMEIAIALFIMLPLIFLTAVMQVKADRENCEKLLTISKTCYSPEQIALICK